MSQDIYAFLWDREGGGVASLAKHVDPGQHEVSVDLQFGIIAMVSPFLHTPSLVITSFF